MDNEVNGDGQSYAYKYRIHDPRIGKFLSIDPLSPQYPHFSPYSFSGNRLIDRVELEGAETIKPIALASNVWFGSNWTYAKLTLVDDQYVIELIGKSQGITWAYEYLFSTGTKNEPHPSEKTWVSFENKLYDATGLENETITPEKLEGRQTWEEYWQDQMNINEGAKAIGSKGEMMVSFINLADGIRNLHKVYKSFKNWKNSSLFKRMMNIATPGNLQRSVMVSGKEVVFKAQVGIKNGTMAIKNISIKQAEAWYDNLDLVGSGKRQMFAFRKNILQYAKEKGMKTVILEFYRTSAGSTKRARQMVMEIDVSTGKTINSQELNTLQTIKNKKVVE